MNLRCWVVVLLAAMAVLGCTTPISVELPAVGTSKATDEDQILRVLDDVHRGMESQRIFRVLAHVSQSYRDAEGRDYKGIQKYLGTVFEQYREIRITRVQPNIVIRSNRALAVETFGTSAVPADSDGRSLNLQGQVNVYLEKIDGTWKVIEWGPIR